MYCPRCAQQCATDVRFCARCGLPLNLIAEVTANGGVAWAADGNPAQGTKSSRQKGIRVGTIIILTSMVLAPLFIAWSILADGPGPLLAPLTIFLTGLSVVLYARAFGENLPNNDRKPYQRVRSANGPMMALPDRPTINGVASRRVNTADIAEPPSVTDHTTQFFD